MLKRPMPLRFTALRTFKWRFVDNLRPSLAYRRDCRPLSGEAARVLEDLERHGVAITSAQALLGDRSLFEELGAAVARLEQDFSEQITAARRKVNEPTGWKNYLLQLLGNHPVLDPSDLFIRFAMQKPILHISNAYFRMYTKLRFYNIWHIVPTQLPARDSQLWHRDPEDLQIVKVFVYLSDVDDGSGPLIYAAGSHAKGRLGAQPAYIHKKGERAKRSDDAQIAQVIPPDRWIKCLGPKGTIVFADTRGYHKGGLAHERDRILYVCMFTSRASKYPALFERPKNLSLILNGEEAFALNP